jgi:N utilization substance protein B
MGKQSAEQVRKTFWNEQNDTDEEVRGYTEDLFRVATDRAEEIDRLIEKHAVRWRIERMAAVDRNILRASVAEFFGKPQVPKVVIINEAIEIARKFSRPESFVFINGVLDSVARDLDQQNPAQQNP